MCARHLLDLVAEGNEDGTALLAPFRQADITDVLAELLVAQVHKINARAERRVDGS